MHPRTPNWSYIFHDLDNLFEFHAATETGAECAVIDLFLKFFSVADHESHHVLLRHRSLYESLIARTSGSAAMKDHVYWAIKTLTTLGGTYRVYNQVRNLFRYPEKQPNEIIADSFS